jgi:two-component system, OmpR family, response regulator
MLPNPVPTSSAVLLVDDDEELVDMLKNYLEREGYSVGVAADGEAGVREALSGRYAIAVVDIMMPRMNGIETFLAIRARSNMPVIMLTAKGDDSDRIVGLEIGADDYIPKPCTPRELTARIRAILRRTIPAKGAVDSAAVIHAGALMMDPQRRAWSGTVCLWSSPAQNSCLGDTGPQRRQPGEQETTVRTGVGSLVSPL